MKKEIIKLREEGKSYSEIKSITGCSKGTISYHCGEGQKKKSLDRQRKNRNKNHPYIKKIEGFSFKKSNKKNKDYSLSVQRRIRLKIEGFHRMHKDNATYVSPSFNYRDVIEKFGENPICYLTGDVINIEETRSYHFDHIVPRSRGGNNSLENLGIATKEANNEIGRAHV